MVKVLKDKSCLYIPLTSTDNIHCLIPYKSRFFGEGCFVKTISVCTEEFAKNNFIGVFDSIKDLNLAINKLKDFLNNNL